VETVFGYPADFDKISDLVDKIRDLRVGRTFAADEAARERLALLEPQAAGELNKGQTGTRVVLLSGAGDPPVADLLVGRTRQDENGPAGSYLMLIGSAGSDSVYLVDQSFRFLDADGSAWLSKGLVDVKPGEVQQVSCYDMRGGDLVYRLLRPAKGKEPALEGLAENEIGDPAKIERVLGALSGMTIDGVAGGRGVVDFSGLETPRRFEYRLFDGSVYIVETGRRGNGDGDEHYLMISADYHPPPQSADGHGPAAEGAAPESGTPSAPSDPKEKLQHLNARIQPWTYTISTWKYEGLVYDRKLLLQQKG